MTTFARGADGGLFADGGVIAQIAELQGLILAAVRAGHVIAAAVAALVGLVDTRFVFVGRGRNQERFGARECPLAVLDQRHRVALADIPLVRVDLVADHIRQVIGAQRVRRIRAA